MTVAASSRMHKLALIGWLSSAALLGGCMTTSSGDTDSGPPPECREDTDCAHLDTDTDPCTQVTCESYKCKLQIVKDSTDCQCATDADCASLFGGTPSTCQAFTCNVHKCEQHVLPAGIATTQTPGDCQTASCDGATTLVAKKPDPTDLPDDQNPCTIDACSADGVVQHTTQLDGTACGDGAVCFSGQCVTCHPQNAASCGTEGPSEPMNNSGSSPAAYQQGIATCGFSDGSDTDWYTFFAKDGDFSFDALRFHFWSTAKTVEACLYVKCENGGTPEGGCSTLLPGPGGSQGCCFTGAPADVHPNWDLDCTGSGEDSGTVYLSVSTPGGGACESYVMSGGY